MKTIIRTKLLDENHVEIRSYELFKQPLKVIYCLSKNYKKCFHIGEDYAIYSLSDQKKGRIINTQQSMYPPYSYYRMYKFLFKPKGMIESTQITDKNITFDNKKNIAFIK